MAGRDSHQRLFGCQFPTIKINRFLGPVPMYVEIMVTDMIARGELDLAEAKANQPINRLGVAEEIA
ncbi:hypothetical protein SAMN05216275_102425 [Streptosporangium canum]|uniref:Uncharacterized protein n=1 Tax=Streptosporangium canum TaxID=324952 RepID=A0A1I3HAT3_9ACTN|nr:hypothetical protein SAMN05216275_102425 [Streptosporangium canum]